MRLNAPDGQPNSLTKVPSVDRTRGYHLAFWPETKRSSTAFRSVHPLLDQPHQIPSQRTRERWAHCRRKHDRSQRMCADQSQGIGWISLNEVGWLRQTTLDFSFCRSLPDPSRPVDNQCGTRRGRLGWRFRAPSGAKTGRLAGCCFARIGRICARASRDSRVAHSGFSKFRMMRTKADLTILLPATRPGLAVPMCSSSALAATSRSARSAADRAPMRPSRWSRAAAPTAVRSMSSLRPEVDRVASTRRTQIPDCSGSLSILLAGELTSGHPQSTNPRLTRTTQVLIHLHRLRAQPASRRVRSHVARGLLQLVSAWVDGQPAGVGFKSPLTRQRSGRPEVSDGWQRRP
jgi:hypothetical protein